MLACWKSKLTVERVKVQHDRRAYVPRAAGPLALPRRRARLGPRLGPCRLRHPARVAHHHQRPVQRGVHRHEDVVLGEQVHVLHGVRVLKGKDWSEAGVVLVMGTQMSRPARV